MRKSFFKIYASLLIVISTLYIRSTPAIADDTTAQNVPDNTITITCTGDCTLGGYKGQGGGNQFKDYANSNPPTYFFANVLPYFANDDLTYINLEGPLTDFPQTVDKTYPIKGETKYIDCLTSSSIEVCNIANNHIYDCGQRGFEQTVNLLNSRNIVAAGEGITGYALVKGKRIAFLGYRGFSNSIANQVQNDVALAKATNDLVIVQFHWGIERENFSNANQEALAHAAIDAGADLVVGNHPHVMQGIEYYNGKIILYSLGNFSFGANKNPSDKDTYIYQAKWQINEDGTLSPLPCSIIPCSISSSTNSNNYQPTPLQGADALRVLTRLSQYSSKYAKSIF